MIATVTDVSDVLQRSLSTQEKKAVEAILAAVESDITATIGPWFETEPQTIRIPGSWSRDLDLPAVAVEGITSITVNGITLTAGSYVWNERSLLRRGVSSLDDLGDFNAISDWTALGMQGAGWQSGLHWGGPASTIEIVYTPSEDGAPAWLKGLVVQAVIRAFSRPAGVASESLGAYSVTFTDGTATITGSLTDAERKLIRRRFTRTSGTIRSGA